MKTQTHSFWAGVGFGLAAAVIWGAWPVISRFGIQEHTLTVWDLTALRFGVSGLLLLPFILRHGHGGIGWGKALVLAFGAGVPYVLVTLTGFTFAPAGHGGLIIPGTMLSCTTIGSWLFLKDRPDRRRLFGLALVLSGILAIGSASWAHPEAYDRLWIGHLGFFLGGLFWAIYTVASRGWAVGPMQATALVSVLSMVLYLPVYLIVKGPALLSAPLGDIVLQGVAQGIVSAVLALLFYTKAVAALGAARAAIFAALVPGLAALFAYPVLGEVPGPYHLIGLALVVTGMVLALGLRRRRG